MKRSSTPPITDARYLRPHQFTAGAEPAGYEGRVLTLRRERRARRRDPPTIAATFVVQGRLLRFIMSKTAVAGCPGVFFRVDASPATRMVERLARACSQQRGSLPGCMARRRDRTSSVVRHVFAIWDGCAVNMVQHHPVRRKAVEK